MQVGIGKKSVCYLLAICLAFAGLPCFAAYESAFAANDTALPLSYFLTNAGYVTPVKMQSPWGDCWSFAVASAVESSILKETADIERAEAEAAQAAEVAAAREAERAAANDASGEGAPETPEGLKKRGGTPMSSSDADSASDGSSETVMIEETEMLDESDASVSAEITPTAASAASAELAAQAEGIDMTQPKLLELNDTIDVSERAIAWLAHELQSEDSAGEQAGEGFYLTDPDNFATQLAEGNFEMIESQLVARQSLVSEEEVPYRYNGYEGSPLWYSTGSYDGASDDARTRDWSVDESVRTSTELGWVVTGLRKMSSPAELQIDYSTGLSEYLGYDADATQDIKDALVEIGGVAIAFEADDALPQEVADGNMVDAPPSEHFTYSTWSQYDGADVVACNHAATIVGWDDNYSASNFAGTSSGQPPADGAWLVKNNWGSDALYVEEGDPSDAPHWGLPASSETGYATSADSEDAEASGFFWLSYYDHSILNPVAFEVTPLDEDFENVYQYDYLGSAEYSKPASYSGEVWVANQYEAKDLELVEAVSAQTFEQNDKVELVVYTLPARLNTDEMTAEEIFDSADSVSHQSATFEYAGFHTIQLERPILLVKGQRFIVAECVSTTGQKDAGFLEESSYLNVELSYLDDIEGVELSTKSQVVENPGETFVSLPDGDWMTIEEYAEFANDNPDAAPSGNVAYGNALVKAFTSTTSMSKNGQIYERVRLK